MDRGKVKSSFLAGFLGFMILSIAIGNMPLGHASFFVALGFLLGYLVALAIGYKKRDPYDLKILEKIDREERYRQIEADLEEMDSAGNAVCLCCGNHFDPLIGQCPHCGKSLYR